MDMPGFERKLARETQQYCLVDFYFDLDARNVASGVKVRHFARAELSG